MMLRILEQEERRNLKMILKSNFNPLIIKGITFDLDDTLYDNKPVIKQAEFAFIDFLKKQFQIPLTLEQFNQFKTQCATSDPELIHDVVTWRMAALFLLLQYYQFDLNRMNLQLIQQAMDIFIDYRNRIKIDYSVLELLNKLSKKYRLGVISNGNADISRIGLSSYFDFALRSGKHGRCKPERDLFLKAQLIWQFKPEFILHVGDNFKTDIIGAHSAHFKTCWLYQEQIPCFTEITQADFIIHSILELNRLLLG